MATNIPPHRLTEVVDAIVQMIDKPDSNVDDLMKHVKGPDFPTGGYIIGRSGSATPTGPAAAGSSCGRAHTSRSCAAASRRSSSPSSRTA